ncbi:molybdenum cofactor guanylyltransferase [Lysobacter korlensis]|uniref:Molybdenum cofactor guanylyltransferase n=1 Tax=Lysobacter korlensis TaxID=553636 RepID=A0ABV6RPF7_9GAMM
MASDHSAPLPGPADTTLGILAGGRGVRLGGVEKAWMQRDGIPQVLRCHAAFREVTCTALVSANRDLPRYRAHGLLAVADSAPAGRGPVAGLAALVAQCRTEWLLTVPVDLVDFDPSVALCLFEASDADGAVALDEDGVQPLVALWRTAALRDCVRALPGLDVAVRTLQARLKMSEVALAGQRFGNLNTGGDLRAAGVRIDRTEQGNEA